VLVRALAIVISIAVLTAIAATALTLLHDDHIASVTRPTPSTTPSTASSSPITSSQSATPSPTTTPVGPITVASAKDFDPEGDGSENPGQVGAAIDGDLSTAWHTVHYLQANLAPKHGVGLVLDLGRAQSVGAVRIDLVGTGTDVQVRTSTSPGTVPGDYTLLGQATKAGKLVTVQGKAAVSARYILIWLTRLPPVPGGFQGGVAEVTVLRA
jgi:cytoskeletal protein RodZ